MVIKVDKSDEFVKSGKKLISEYEADSYFDREVEEKQEFLSESVKNS